MSKEPAHYDPRFTVIHLADDPHDHDYLEPEPSQELKTSEISMALWGQSKNAERRKNLDTAWLMAQAATRLESLAAENEKLRMDKGYAETWNAEHITMIGELTDENARLQRLHTAQALTISSLRDQLDEAVKMRDIYVQALTRLKDCDWVTTPQDRMDAVRDIARKALLLAVLGEYGLSDAVDDWGKI